MFSYRSGLFIVFLTALHRVFMLVQKKTNFSERYTPQETSTPQRQLTITNLRHIRVLRIETLELAKSRLNLSSNY